jgi:hypothetical protein
MKRWSLFRRLLTPLVYLAALFLLFEEWLWRAGARLMSSLSRFPPLHALEDAIRRLPPYPALLTFVLPAVMLFPVKILALLAIAHGHIFSGVAVILVAKLGGAAAVARIYVLTRPTLLTLGWFARWHQWFLFLKDRWIARLRASEAWRLIGALNARMAAARRRWSLAWRHWREQRRQAMTRRGLQPLRVLRRFAARRRMRRRS